MSTKKSLKKIQKNAFNLLNFFKTRNKHTPQNRAAPKITEEILTLFCLKDIIFHDKPSRKIFHINDKQNFQNGQVKINNELITTNSSFGKKLTKQEKSLIVHKIIRQSRTKPLQT